MSDDAVPAKKHFVTELKEQVEAQAEEIESLKERLAAATGTQTLGAPPAPDRAESERRLIREIIVSNASRTDPKSQVGATLERLYSNCRAALLADRFIADHYVPGEVLPEWSTLGVDEDGRPLPRGITYQMHRAGLTPESIPQGPPSAKIEVKEGEVVRKPPSFNPNLIAGKATLVEVE